MLKLSALCGLLCLALSLRAVAAEDSTAQAQRHSPDVLRADFDELYARLRASHFDLYARRTKQEFDRLHANMRRGLNKPLDASEAAVEFQQFVAFAQIAHARIDFPSAAAERMRRADARLFPLAVRVADGGLYVTHNLSGIAELGPGAEILEVDGMDAKAFVRRLTRHLSADNEYMAHTLLEFSAPRSVWLEFGEPRALTVRVRSENGRSQSVVLPFRTRAEQEAERARQPKQVELSWEAREHRMLSERLAYLRPGPFYEADPNASNPWDTREFAAFIDRAFRSFNAAGATALILDLRDNPGGDNSFSDLMLNWFATRPYRFASSFRVKVSEAAIESNRKRLESTGAAADSTSAKFAALYAGRKPGDIVDFEIPLATPRTDERFGGKVYVLINRHSYSNTVMVAATVQDYGFGTVMGEETSDLATTYGAMEQFTLSRTGVVVGFPKARIVRPSGELSPRGVVPDVVIATPIAPSAQDVVLNEAVRLISR